MSIIKIKEDGGFRYVEEGEGPVLLLIHGLFGALSNWRSVVETFTSDYKVLIPLMPIYEKPAFEIETSVEGLKHFIHAFVNYKKIEMPVIIGNSLGGHVALKYTISFPQKVKALVLTGSSGLYESGMGSEFPRYKSYPFIKERVEYTFFSPVTATKELVDEVFGIVNDNFKALRVLRFARSAQKENLSKDVSGIKNPTLLVWGLNDNITPPNVAHEFNSLIPASELQFIDSCGHAAMMEQPEKFNRLVRKFLDKLK
ncbi:MAG: alpha/beta hydrolase [Bacteroidia bacterium]|nr:alpha/beta hydrolase [Bacteroidia bacterium]